MALPYDPEALLNRDPIRGLFDLALNLTPPWKVAGFLFDPDGRRLDINLDFERGARFACPQCGAADCPVHDTEAKEWRHLNFFQHEAYLHARVPRTRCERCGVHLVAVPWARKGSLFTLLFEALTMAMMREMPVKATGRIVGEHDTKLWRVLHHYVDVARAKGGLLRSPQGGRGRDQPPPRPGLRDLVRRPGAVQGLVCHPWSRPQHGCALQGGSGGAWRRSWAGRRVHDGHVGGLPQGRWRAIREGGSDRGPLPRRSAAEPGHGRDPTGRTALAPRPQGQPLLLAEAVRQPN